MKLTVVGTLKLGTEENKFLPVISTVIFQLSYKFHTLSKIT